jgi:hypothetical protein
MSGVRGGLEDFGVHQAKRIGTKTIGVYQFRAELYPSGFSEDSVRFNWGHWVGSLINLYVLYIATSWVLLSLSLPPVTPKR